MSKFIDLIRQRFGKLTVVKQVGKDKWRQALWLCKCDFGNSKIICGNNLKNSHTKSCSCLRAEITKQRSIKHGHAQGGKSKTYTTWKTITQRCTNPNHKYYDNYGGRGIKICKRWKKFENFLEDMGECPPGYQIDRINNNKGYSKENCRWTTSKMNNRNRRDNHLEIYNGKTQCLANWAEEYKINYSTLLCRLNADWSIEKALTTPIKKRKKNDRNSNRKTKKR